MTDAPAGPEELPSLRESVAYIGRLGKPTAAEVLDLAQATGRVALQPRCGVGGHREMAALLAELEREGRPDILTLTIDAHTRLLRWEHAERALRADPLGLNGYPLVTHGWRRGRELNESVSVPLEIRHGSPDPRALFATSVAAGITSFEGGGISYNLPYSKDVPLAHSLAAWAEVDAACGELARLGTVVDRELFGTLTAVLVPPSISLAISVLEAVAATAEGVRCVSVSYPQSGHLAQDVAALRAIPELAGRYLPAGVRTHAVLHEFMGVFPRERHHAEELIFYGALTARLGGASKMITKTYQEAHGIPDAAANVAGLRLAGIANSQLLDFVTVDEEAVSEEQRWICREVAEIVEPVLAAPRLHSAIVTAFAEGRLDIPFSASRHAHSAIIPRRDPSGAIRYHSHGRLPLSPASVARNQRLLAAGPGAAPGATPGGDLFQALRFDIDYFPHLFSEAGDGGSAR
ncbi:methylaspartate mutase [Streptomyces sp. LX-29]|uniref:methylaspartate mutase n=1 Tax=Streptomyces sp. LX-29 TaxID=2900152 RepID=UPI00240D9F89|nr:methylaspartate mutase [Streptomyces sp. LX-29]WFB09670.1 methylaspartate mutase [Streptomyces sp. LX-29]